LSGRNLLNVLKKPAASIVMQRSTLKMEAEVSSGTSVNFYYIARRNIPYEINFMLKI
jgi:hypothetical protein